MAGKYKLRSAHTWRGLLEYINELGFLPLFKNEIAGFSAEEMTFDMPWWSGVPELDPWYWREEIARSGEAAYGKFFAGKAGFLSLEWLPVFANWRRDGYDFDARWDDGRANIGEKKILDCFAPGSRWMSTELEQAAGFGKGGEKNYAGITTLLQMETYLVTADFRRRVNKRGGEYGMTVAVLAPPEELWGAPLVRERYSEEPRVSRERVFERARELFPRAGESALRHVLGFGGDRF